MNFNRVICTALLNNTISDTLNDRGKNKATRRRCFSLTPSSTARLHISKYFNKISYILASTSQVEICLTRGFLHRKSSPNLIISSIHHILGTGWDDEHDEWGDVTSTTLSYMPKRSVAYYYDIT